MATTPPDLLATLQKIQRHDLHILRLSQSVSASPPVDATRSSDVSDAFSNLNSTPATLQADLSHYKELFSKLRFSYLEQVTKEKFLRAITEDSPQLAEQEENDELEQKLLEAKAELREIKDDVVQLLSQLEALSKKLAEENRIVQDYLSKATSLPSSTELMEEEIVMIEKEHEGSSSELNLPLSDTLALVSSSEAELARLEKELATVHVALPKKMARLKLLENEIKPMEMDKEGLERFASEAVRMRDSARAEGKADRENMGRWYKSVFEGLESLLQGS